jgi:hypothetical protein
MGDDISVAVVTLHQPLPKKTKTGTERARDYRERKKGRAPFLHCQSRSCLWTPPSTPTGTVTPIPPPTVTVSPRDGVTFVTPVDHPKAAAP